MAAGPPGGVVGVVLTGGRSSRMGTDKALVLVDGVAMARRVADALAAAGCDPVWCQGGDRERLATLGLLVHPDDEPGAGPLPAIASALAAAGPHDLFVSACDLPDLDGEAVARVIEIAGERPDALAVVGADAAGAHLIGLWRQAAAPVLAALVADGQRSYRGALDRLGAVKVDVPMAAVRNVNRPEDLPR